MPDSRFTGSTVLVAGGTGALGSAISTGFAREGANVVVTYHSLPEYRTFQADAAASGLKIEGEQVDVTDETALGQFSGRILARYSSVDVIVNAVGGYAGGANLWELESALLDRMVALNLRSIHGLARVGVPVMLKQGRGCIVNVAAKSGLDHPAKSAVYAASKAAALSLMASLAAEVKGTGIRVNSVLPNIIDTPANRRSMPNAAAMTKWSTPEQIAAVILFLCSRDAAVVHGAAVPV